MSAVRLETCSGTLFPGRQKLPECKLHVKGMRGMHLHLIGLEVSGCCQSGYAWRRAPSVAGESKSCGGWKPAKA